jgi:hypothetical protein
MQRGALSSGAPGSRVDGTPLKDQLRLSGIGTSPDADGWASRIKRGLVQITDRG